MFPLSSPKYGITMYLFVLVKNNKVNAENTLVDDIGFGSMINCEEKNNQIENRFDINRKEL
jgi:hypothetical protein